MIAFHGTNKEAAEKIRMGGFRAGSWFARKLEWAVKFGGLYVFAVEFSDDPQMWHGELWEDDWQFHTAVHIPSCQTRGCWCVPQTPQEAPAFRLQGASRSKGRVRAGVKWGQSGERRRYGTTDPHRQGS